MPKGTCAFPDCSHEILARGYCRHHYSVLRRFGESGLYAVFEPCTVEGCEKLIHSRVRMMCRGHAQRMANYGSPDPLLSTRMRLMERVVDTASGCTEWTGSTNGNGYGIIGLDGGNAYVHRVSWEMHRGPIADGLTIDHLCRNTLCINPDHLEPVTLEENIRRRAEAQTHCANGHEFTEENTYRWKGATRSCRACAAEHERARRRRIRDAS